MGKIIIVGELTRRAWAKRIAQKWKDATKQMLAAIFAVGNDLIEAKKSLEHGEWIALIERELPFGRRTAHMLMKVAQDARLSNGKRVSHLPPHWGTLYQLTRLDDATFERLSDDGTIRPDMQRNEVAKVLRISRVADDERRVLDLKPIKGKFRTLVIDPAWEYDWLSVAGRAKPGYAMQSLDQLRALDLNQWAADECHLYCWTTNNFVYEAGKLVDLWGFQHRTVLTWIKPPPFGLGSYFRNSTEQCIFATKGDTTTRPAASSIPTHFEAPRGEHSEKPEKFYDIVRAASYPPYGEGNQREKRKDFVSLWQPEPTMQAAE
jgi:N6-adenosine-specific RNA methylase IME4